MPGKYGDCFGRSISSWFRDSTDADGTRPCACVSTSRAFACSAARRAVIAANMRSFAADDDCAVPSSSDGSVRVSDDAGSASDGKSMGRSQTISS